MLYKRLKREYTEKKCREDDDMKKVLLLGDSIRMGYDDYVKELLKDEYDVVYSDWDNGRFAAYTLWQANQLLRLNPDIELVHWNNGYWDMHAEAPMTEELSPVAEYQHFLRRIIKLFRDNGVKVVFATTTPVPESGVAEDVTGTGGLIAYDNAQVQRYNAAALEVMEAEKVPVNDLYTLCCQDANLYKCEDQLHLTEEGYQVCARQIADCIRREMAV